MPITAYSRSRRRVLLAMGRLELNFCATRSESITWPGEGWNRVLDMTRPQFHEITAGPGSWGGAAIRTERSTHPQTGDISWRTVVYLSGGKQADSIIKEWHTVSDEWDEDPTNLYPPPPSEKVWVQWQSSMLVEEWAYEQFFPGIRPETPESMRFYLRHKAVKINTAPGENPFEYGQWTTTGSCTGGGSGEFTSLYSGVSAMHWAPNSLPQGDSSAIPDNDETSSAYEMYVRSEFNQTYYDAQYQDLPYPNAVIASALGLALDGPLYWIGQAGSFNVPYSVPVIKSDVQPVHTTQFNFVARIPSDNLAGEVQSFTRRLVPVTGAVRDWNGPLLNVPYYESSAPDLNTPKKLFSGSYNIESPIELLPDVQWMIANEYDTFNTASLLILREGSPWNALRVNKEKLLQVEGFVSPPVAWTTTDCSTAISADGLACTATGANPSIERDLKNDFNDLSPDLGIGPTPWFTANGGSVDPWILDWRAGETEGPSISLRGPGEWVRIGRRLLPTSDVFNWSTFRYARLRASADASCTVEVTIEWDDLNFVTSGDPDLEGFAIQRFPRTVTYEVDLTATLSDHEIDLSSGMDVLGERVGHYGLRCVKSVKYSFPAGRIVTFGKVELFEKTRPTLDVHIPMSDEGLINGLVDGKGALLLTVRERNGGDYPHSIWGLPGFERVSFNKCSLLMKQLAYEIQLQESWTASELDTATDNRPNFAVWLNEAFQVPLGPTNGVVLTARRGYGGLSVYPRHDYRIDGDSNLGNAIHGLVFHPDTHEPVVTDVVAETVPLGSPFDDPATIPRGTELDGSVSQADGRFRLELVTEGPVELRSSPGSAEQMIYPRPVPVEIPFVGTKYELLGELLEGRTWWLPAFSGVPNEEEGEGGVVLDIDRIGNRMVSMVREADGIVLARWLGEEADWSYLPVGQVGFNPWVYARGVAESYIAFNDATEQLFLLYNVGNGAGEWKLVTIGNGTHPVIKYDEAWDILFVTYCRDNNIYMKRSSNGGQTFLESEITVKTAMPPAHYTFDWLHDNHRTLILAYSTGTTVELLTSTDHGLTWS